MCKQKCWQINRALRGVGFVWVFFVSITQCFCCFAGQRAVYKTAIGISRSASGGGHLHPPLNPDPLTQRVVQTSDCHLYWRAWVATRCRQCRCRAVWEHTGPPPAAHAGSGRTRWRTLFPVAQGGWWLGRRKSSGNWATKPTYRLKF